MSFDKLIPAKIAEYKIYDVESTDELRKEASDIYIPDDFVYDPEFLYLWIRIVSAGEFYGSNKNADYFPEDELKEHCESFKEAHPFKNHENKVVEKAIGKIFSVRWNPVMKCVELLKGIDKKRAPEVARGYEKGYLTDVSMGCKVPYTICSVCGNKARKKSEFCNHVRYHRNKLLANGERVYEINYKPKFHDSSTVLNGAERVAKAFLIIDSPPDNAIVSSFRESSTREKTAHFLKVSEPELEKVAEAQKLFHPLIQNPLPSNELSKVASSPMMRKIAELEKELTGKLLNIVSEPDKEKEPEIHQMLEVIKFLTEKRMDDESLVNIAESVKEVAKENGVPLSRAFTTLIGVAELMGIEFFPTELHTLLTHLTDAKLSDAFHSKPVQDSPVYPSEYAGGMERAVRILDSPKDFKDPAALLNLYNESAHRKDEFLKAPVNFISSLDDEDELDERPPVRVIRIIKKTLEPIAPSRSYHREHLMPRISVVLSGNRPILGGADVRRDLDMLTNPGSLGDLIGGLSYGMYERMRPGLFNSRFVKLAGEELDGLEKVAAKEQVKAKKPKKISAMKLALVGVPVAYGASAFQKSKRDNGRYLSDGQNFVADHPGMMMAGAMAGGAGAARSLNNVNSLIRRGGRATAEKGRRVKGKTQEGWAAVKEPFRKESSEYVEAIVKEAESYSSGTFNIFEDNQVLKKYAEATGATGEQAAAVKMALLLSVGGMEKEAKEILHHYNIPSYEKGRMLKVAAFYLDAEMEKAAEDFTNNMLLSAIGDTSPLARTLPGRAVDAFVFKKLGQIGEDDEKKKKKLPTKPDIEGPTNTKWTESYRQGPALYPTGKGADNQ